jgi:hypothetical protein
MYPETSAIAYETTCCPNTEDYFVILVNFGIKPEASEGVTNAFQNLLLCT